MTGLITIKDKQFKPFISKENISLAVKKLANSINEELKHANPIFIAVLNGSFMFAADLLREINMPCEISFVKLASYEALGSTGKVQELIGLKENVEGRTVVIIEDIVDSGITIETLVRLLQEKKAHTIKVATILMKPDAYNKTIPIDYIGFKIANDFVIGYGLDYDGQGRNLNEIHVLA